MYLREDQARIIVQVDGVTIDNQPWQSYEGGDIESSSTNTHPGGMQDAVDLGGPVARTDVTVKRMYTPDVLHLILDDLETACGNAKFTVSWTPLDADKNPSGSTKTRVGILKTVQAPNWDANATAAALLTLTAGMNVSGTEVAS